MTTATQPVGRVNWKIIIIGFLAVMIDGFDTAALAGSIPALAESWGVEPGAFTYPLVLTNIGVVIGYLMSGRLGASLGRKTLLIASVAACAVTTALSAVAIPLESMAVFSVIRLLAGIAIGVVLPVAVSISADLAPERYRQRISAGVTLGLATGLTVGGVFGGSLIEWFGTGGMFWAGALAALPLLALMIPLLEEPPAVGTKQEAQRAAGVARLFEGSMWSRTLLLWAFAFLVFIAAYTLTSWVPTLLLDYGFTANEAPIGLAFVSFGGVLGGILLIPMTARAGISASLVVMSLLGVIAMVTVGLTDFGSVGVLLLLLGAGAGVTASQIGQLTLAVSIYSAGARTTGVGLAAAIGRIGSIVGPGAAGILIALKMSASNIILVAAIPVAVACVAAVGLTLQERRRNGSGPADDPAAVDHDADGRTNHPIP